MPRQLLRKIARRRILFEEKKKRNDFRLSNFSPQFFSPLLKRSLLKKETTHGHSSILNIEINRERKRAKKKKMNKFL